MNKKDSHSNRMRSLNAIAAPLEGTPEFARLKEDFEANPEPVKTEATKRYKIAQASVRAQMNGGAGHHPDKALRHFLAEYNHRAWNHGLRRLPLSFNVLEPFFEYDEKHIRFRLLPEVDYLFSIEDFFDFATQPGTPDASVANAMNLEEGVIYNYSAYDDPAALSMQMDSGLEYVVAGVSMLRRGSELTVLLVAGEKGQAENTKSYSWEDFVNYSGIVPDESNPVEPVRLSGAPDYVQAYAVCRFDIESRELQVRYLMLDAGRYFFVHSDDPNGLGPLTEQEIAKSLSASNKALDRRATLFELAKTVVLLPSYIQARIGVVQEEVQPTVLARQAKESLTVRSALEAVPLESKIFSRRILTVKATCATSLTPAATGRVYTPPQFQIPVKGFWRVLRDSSGMGHDELGNAIKGKTWVKPHARHAESPTAPKVVYVKSSRGYARRPVETYRGKMATVANGSAQAALASGIEVGAEPSYLYVFRCPAHGLDIYKVGYTDRDPDSRARELSSTTGSPVAFLVVQAWAVVDGHAAEIAAHKALENYRLASNREFFRGTYMILREKIEAAIATFLLEQPPE